uniref:Variable lymphocyte receptor n=1 Tax=Petromyzon marinus TaxID=7757 RepID=Q6E4B6_PETMA|nr:variable lymphocyte receptor [Petromyzon marinus]AAT70326.1 variable lymphocyte receptor [Petromyzon marinus]
MWIKWIATLVAFGALVQSAVACPSQCSCDQTTVKCHSRRLTSVPAGIPTNRQNLWLHDNQITKLEPGVFDRLTELTILDLRTNQLQALPTLVFDNLTQLSILNMHTNQLKSIPRGAFDNLKSLTHIYLFNNPWDCECSDILYLKNWIVQHASIVNPGSGGVDNVKCAGTNTPVRAVTEASTSPSKCPGYVATTTTPTTTTPEFIPETTTSPQPVITTQKPKPLWNFNCTSIQERKNDGGDCGKPACTTLLNCANFLSCLCSTCALCRKR